MKLTKFANFLVFTSVLALAIGCQKAPVAMNTIHGPYTTAPDVGLDNGKPLDTNAGVGGTNSLGGGIRSNPPGSREGWTRTAETLQAYTVHFDFDSTAIKDSEKSHVASVVDYLKAKTSNAVEIEGNCDERGTEEYNRALGDRRALALREEMVRLGVDPTRVDTKSYGEDRPAVEGHDESAYRQNRRGVFILLTPPKMIVRGGDR